MRQIFMERHSKGEFHVLVEELKLFYQEFFFKNIVLDILIFYSDVLHCQFWFFLSGCIHRFPWLIIISNSFPLLVLLFLFCFFNPKSKICGTRKRNYCVFSRCACAKLKISLSAEKFQRWAPALTSATHYKQKIETFRATKSSTC